MVQGYFSLNEAAKVLGMPPDELRQMAQKNQIRSFQDRGTLRFRQADIQELSRRRGATSDPDLVLAEPRTPPRTPTAPKSGGAPKSDSAPKSGPKSPAKSPKSPQPEDAPEVFDFAIDGGDDKLDIGQERLSDGGAKSGGKSSGKKLSSESDSDVKLVANAGPDSDVKLVSGPKTPRAPGQRTSVLGPQSPSPKKSSRLAGGAPSADSGVRMVATDSDSDVKIVGAGAGDEISLGEQPPPSATDSDIRLEQVVPPPRSDDSMSLTDEINLDEEIRKQEAVQKSKPKSRIKPKSELKLPTQSPFELSDSDIDASTAQDEKRPSSSDFELTPGGAKPESSGSIVLEPQSDDFSMEMTDDSGVLTGSGEGELTGPSSGISLSNPVDAGISLEEGADTEQLDLDMSLEVEGTPKPVKREDASDSGSSSEFELSLETEGGKPASDDSSSEFELTLDDSSGEMSPLEEASPQAKAGSKAEKDIFETDFEVPALADDSGSQVAALETSDADLESSDFDLALDDSDLAVEDESGSQVVALDEESADEAAETLAGDIDDLEVPVGAEEEDEEAVGVGPERVVVREKLIEPAPWPAWPGVVMIPCVALMVLISIMGFELVQLTAGFKSAGFVTKMVGGIMNQNPR